MHAKGYRKHRRKKTSAPKISSAPDLSTVSGMRQIAAALDSKKVPKPFKTTPEDVALSCWFSTFVLYQRDSDSRRGYLEYLLPLYTSAKHDSPLSLATSALALLIFGLRPTHRPVLASALKIYGDALASIRQALCDTTESKSDQTLMAVLLVGMAEVSLTFLKSSKGSESFGEHSSLHTP